MTIKTFEFEGEIRTAAEIRAMVPRLSGSTIRAHLSAGRNTRIAMLSFDPKAASAAAARRTYAKRGTPSHLAMRIDAECKR